MPADERAFAIVAWYKESMTRSQRQPVAISLFAGAGGCSLGFKRASYNVIFALDLDQAAVETYRANFPETRCDTADIRGVDFGGLMRELDLGPGELDMLIGGPPCQGFSTAGQRFWDDPRNALLKSYAHALQALQPKWFMMENVEGLLTTNNGESAHEAAKAFIDLGYRIRIDKVYAHEYGIPQRRKRVLVIGNRLGIDFALPEPVVNATGAIFRKVDFTLRRAIAGLPPARQCPTEAIPYAGPPVCEWEAEIRNPAGTVTDHYYPAMNGVQLQRIKSLQPGQTMKDLPAELQHASFRRRAKRRVMDGTPSEKRGGAPSGLKRLVYDEPCLTITGAATREFIHPVEDRPLTNRECARVQTFPDTFEFVGTGSQRIQQIGNAIPPKLAQVFAEHIGHCGFDATDDAGRGLLLGFLLTKTSGMSPALEATKARFQSLLKVPGQMALFALEAQ